LTNPVLLESAQRLLAVHSCS